jgi:hypothetical protein
MSVENKETTQIDPRLLVQWLGTIGAKAALMQSKHCTIEVLLTLAKSLGLTPAKATARPRLVDEIVKAASKRIDIPIEELYQMSIEDLLTYFQRIEPTSEELLDLLRTLELNPKKEGHKSLMELAARELSETGRFLRIASSSGRGDDKNR